jgi:hypothetical protein
MGLSAQTAYTMSKIAYKTFTHLQNARIKRQKKRLAEFAQYFETRYEVMTNQDKQKLNQFIESEEGESLLADYTDSILKVSSSRVMMAMALLFCDGTDFTDVEKSTFIIASKDLSDDLINFYILAHKKEKYEHNNLPYAKCSFSNDNCHIFLINGWDQETISLYIEQLIRLKFLLPDPLPITGFTTKSNIWSLNFGISNKTQRVVNLLVKSEALLINSSS